MLKKQKLMVGLCTPAVALTAAAGVSAIFLTQNNASIKGDYRLSFSTDENSRFVDDEGMEQNVYSGTTLDRIKQPQVQSYKSGYMFTGWQDETGHPVPGQYKVCKNQKLQASFADSQTGDYVTVTFKKKSTEPDVKLHGNVSIGVKKGYLFLMVNRPSAEWDNNYFNNWQTYDSEKKEYVDISESDVISSDTVLYPKFTEAVTMTWNAGEGGGITRGQSTTTLASGTVFGKFNQPQLYNEDLNKVFAGWYKDEECSVGQEWSATETVTTNSTAYAKWDTGTTTDQYHHILNFVQNDDQVEQEGYPEVIFAPSTSTIVEYTQSEPREAPTWKEAVRPTITTEDGNYEVESYEYYDDTSTSWKELTDDHKFETNLSTQKISTKIRPVMRSSIEGINIVGESTVLPESTTTYTAVVSGSASNPLVSQNVTWGLYSDKECKSPVISGAKIDQSTGVLTVESLTKSVTYYIKATSNATVTEVSATFEVTVEMPYVNSQSFWFHDGKQWWSISQKDGLCVEGDMTAYALNESTTSASKTITRGESFTYKLYVGRLLTSIYDQFGYKWTGFNGEIDLGDSNVTVINGSFLEGCTSFNQTLDLHKITKIGDSFLYGCTTFGTPEKTEEGEVVYTSMLNFSDAEGKSALKSIGDNFLGCCTSYNRILTLPTTNELTIGDAFLYKCSAFNQDITFPSNLVSVDDFFMMGCDSFMSTVTVESTKTTFVENINSISSTSSGANIYVYGFKVSGAGATAFKTAFPTHTTNNAWRKVNDSESQKKQLNDSTSWDNAIQTIFSTTPTAPTLTGNYTVVMPDEFKGITASVADGAMYDDGTGRIITKNTTSNSNVLFNNTWNVYSQYGDSTDYRWYGLLEGTSIPAPYELYGSLFGVSLSGAEGEFGYDDFEFVESTGKYKLKSGKTFHVYRDGKSIDCEDIQLEFYPVDDPTATTDRKLYQITITCQELGGTMTWTFNNYGTTKLPSFTEGSRRAVIDTVSSTSTASAYAATPFTFSALDTEENLKTVLFNSGNITGMGEPTKILQIKLLDSTSMSTKHEISNGGYSAFVYDSTGKEIAPKSVSVNNGCLYVEFDETPSKDYLYSVSFIPSSTSAVGVSLTAQATWIDLTGTENFTTCDWTEVITWCEYVEAGTKSTADFCAHFNDGYQVMQSMDDFLGLERSVVLHGLEHKIRVIGTQHDTITTGQTYAGAKATLTFELVQVFSNTYGYVFGTKWNTTNESWDYTSSTLRANLTGNGGGTAGWADGSTTSAVSILETENTNLSGHLKFVDKQVAVNSSKTEGSANWALTTYSDNMFVLTYSESEGGSSYCLSEGTQYKFYSSKTADERKAARTRYTVKSTWTTTCWMVTPLTTLTHYVYITNSAGAMQSNDSTTQEMSVAFAFCI